MSSSIATPTAKRPAVATLPAMAIIVIASYVAAQMIADVASLKIALIAGLAVDMGTFVYPFTFTLRDAVHKVIGKRGAQVLIICTAVINLFMVLYFWWVASVPPDPGTDPDGSFALAFAFVFGPLWRIVLASILAEVISELADTEAYHYFVTRITRNYQWGRVLFSNAISIPIDNLIFVLIAFAPLPFFQGHFLTVPWSSVWEIFLFNLIVKFGVTLISIPLIYLVPDRDWENSE